MTSITVAPYYFCYLARFVAFYLVVLGFESIIEVSFAAIGPLSEIKARSRVQHNNNERHSPCCRILLAS